MGCFCFFSQKSTSPLTDVRNDMEHVLVGAIRCLLGWRSVHLVGPNTRDPSLSCDRTAVRNVATLGPTYCDEHTLSGLQINSCDRTRHRSITYHSQLKFGKPSLQSHVG